MQFKNIEQLKQFITWAKQNKLASVQVGEISFTFSDVRILSEPATQEPVAEAKNSIANTEEPDPDLPSYTPNSKSWVDVDQSQEDENELLYWSAKPN